MNKDVFDDRSQETALKAVKSVRLVKQASYRNYKQTLLIFINTKLYLPWHIAQQPMPYFTSETAFCTISANSTPGSIYLSVRYKTNNEYYQLWVKEKELQTLAHGYFGTLDQFFGHMHAVRAKQELFFSDKQGLIYIKVPNQSKDILLQANPIQNSSITCQNESKFEAELPQSSLQETYSRQRYPFQDSTFITGDQQKEQLKKLGRQQLLCYRAVQLLKEGATGTQLSSKLSISVQAARKMAKQLQHFGRIYLPRGPRPNFDEPTQQAIRQEQHESEAAYQQNLIQLNLPAHKYGERVAGVGFNTKLPNQTVEKIKRMLLGVIREGKMQSYQEMQQYLQQINIYRSLSSIYRHVNSLKAAYPELQTRNFAMHKKDVFGLDSAHSPKEPQK